MLAVTQALSRSAAARLFSGNLRRLFPAETYQTMLAENFIPAGIAQTREEMRAVAAAIPQFRARRPDSRVPDDRAVRGPRRKGRERQNAAIREHQRRYAESLPDGRFVSVDSGHFIQAERPELVAEHARALLDRTTEASDAS